MQEIHDLWNKVLTKLEMLVTVVSFDLWIKTIEVIDFKDGKTLVLVASSTFAKNQLNKNHSGQLKESIESVFGDNVNFEILDAEEKEAYIKKKKQDNSGEDKEIKEEVSSFNEKYTFDNFVVGKSNQFVYAAARSVAENPGEKFNPLFIYGGVGLGKTHILNAIGNFVKQNSPDKKIMYVTCEKFTNDYIDSLRASKEKEKANLLFREKYRNLDILMIDDIQFISNKTSTQEEFFHTFNELYQKNKQIIISSDRPPKEIATLEDRLRSRFQSGLIQDIQAPDFETKIAILKKKVEQERYNISEDVLEFIAENVNTNVREMEGLLSKVYFYATLIGKKQATLFEAREVFKDQQEVQKEQTSPSQIITAVCAYFGISEAEIVGKKRSKEIVEPRMIAIYLINEILDLPLTAIGQLFGGRDHTTIIHARDKINEQLKSNNKIRTIVNEIKNQLRDNV
ncbi:MAG: chromosomal replication initiator protein DnaA [Christensenellales bacterium]|jgi:chromosomal replication initiator protein